tara:strand:+ start:339 stop:866 length:528 start_codon:yes stop_codon:yes gene_type:complete
MATLNATNLKHASSSSNNIVLNADGSTTISNLSKAGKILQAKCTPSNSVAQASTTSNTYTDVTGIDLTFTPLFANSTIILVTSFHGTALTNVNFSVRLTFNHSGISQTPVDSNQDGYSISSTGGYIDTYGTMCYTHTPSTTNEITYRFQFRSINAVGTAYFNKKVSKIIAYEVAA